MEWKGCDITSAHRYLFTVNGWTVMLFLLEKSQDLFVTSESSPWRWLVQWWRSPFMVKRSSKSSKVANYTPSARMLRVLSTRTGAGNGLSWLANACVLKVGWRALGVVSVLGLQRHFDERGPGAHLLPHAAERRSYPRLPRWEANRHRQG